MKTTILTLTILLTLTACATGGSKASKRLPDGNYQLVGIDKDGKETTNIVNIDVPFNDPGYAVGMACATAPTTTMVVIEQMGKVVRTAVCTRR